MYCFAKYDAAIERLVMVLGTKMRKKYPPLVVPWCAFFNIPPCVKWPWSAFLGSWAPSRCASVLVCLSDRVFLWVVLAQTMSALGAEVTEVSLPSLPQQCAAYYVNALSEASANLARFDGIRYG